MPNEATSQPTNGIFRRIFRTLGICLAVSLSLLCFPHWLPWMIAFWLLWHSALVYRLSPGYWPLFACAIILVVRLVPSTPAMWLLVASLIAIGIWRFRIRKRLPSPRRLPTPPQPKSPQRLWWISPMVLWIVWGLMFVEYRRAATCNHAVPFHPGRPVVCIGDSLTDGMIPDPGYPGQLETMLSISVINEGVSGISTSPALGVLQRAMKYHPQAVIIELGGHDFLKWHSRSSTKANLIKLVELCRQHDCEPILMEIPRGFMIDPYASLEREIAYEFDLQLIDDRWLRHIVLMSPAAPPGMWIKSKQLSDDGIHSNPRGSRAIAEFAADALVQLYGDQVLKSR